MGENERDREMEIEHFSHRHPLMFKEEQKKDVRLAFCNGCEEAVFGPSYSCNQCSNLDPVFTYNLHKSCAELPLETHHPIHRKHPLKLQSYKDPFTVFTCDACNQPCRLAYTCSPCGLALDLKCASNWQHLIENRSHVHQFTVLRKRIPFDCDVCGGTWESVPYLCTICHLLVGKECANTLPHRIRITAHQHRLMLIWFLEDAYPKDEFCKICYTNTDRSRSVYHCHRCGYVAHTLCALGEITDTVDDDDDDNDEDSKVLDQEAEQWNMGEDQIELAAGQQVKHFSHDQHFLVLRDEVKDHDGTITCDGCMRPITISSNAFYSCAEQEQCRFFLHKTCAHLPKTILHPLHRHQLTLLSAAPSFDTVFKCHMCRMLSQGFSYYCNKCDVYLDLQCISFSNPLTHDAHRHPLFFNFYPDKNHCRGCGISLTDARFSCIKCNFHLCVPCVKLPPTTRYKYHDDPLKLAYHSEQNELGEYHCEICEGERDPAHWFYNSTNCDFDCHPHCILGRHPQVKLGSSCKHVGYPHLFTLVDKRKSVIPFDKRENILPCEACGQPCQGLVLECSECNTNFHREGNCSS